MGDSVLRFMVKGILGRLVAFGALTAGLMQLYRGFQAGNLGTGVPLWLAGGAAILIGMYLMAVGKRGETPTAKSDQGPLDSGIEEDEAGDPIHGSNQGS